MSAPVQIPVRPSEGQRFQARLGETTYNFRLTFDDAQGGCWIMDIGDAGGATLIAGIPLVSGTDLLAQYRHLGFAGGLVITTDRGAGEVPKFDDLGVTSSLFFVPD